MNYEYELRVNGKVKSHSSIIGREEIECFLQTSKENPGSRVEIVYVVEHIVVNNFTYNLMESHFKIKAKEDNNDE